MLKISFASELDRLRLTLNDFGRRQLPYAASLALNEAASRARRALEAEMAVRFDRPKPWTINSLYIVPSRKTRLEANVHFKDRWESGGKSGVPAGVYLQRQIEGGPRGQKSHERALTRAGILPPGYFLVPTKWADMDAYGNMASGQITKILSSLGGFTNVGFTANWRKGSRSRGVRKSESYFAIVPGRGQGPRNEIDGGGLPPAIYKVTYEGGIRRERPVAAIVRQAPNYGRVFDFYGIAMRTYEQHMPRLMGEALEYALRTARP